MKLRVQAKPVEGAANEAARKLLAKVAGIAKAQVELIRGAASRDKDFILTCQDPEAAAERLRKAAGMAKQTQ